jgi:hypothetical protein
MQDVKTAIAELQRCVRELGFKGAMINRRSALRAVLGSHIGPRRPALSPPRQCI